MRELDFVKGIQYGFQDPSSTISIGIQDLHHEIFFWLITIFTVVLIVIIKIVKECTYIIENTENEGLIEGKRLLKIFQLNHINKNKINHGSILEILWTIAPTIILIMIALPSFALLYSMEEIKDPNETVKVIGNQWYWTFEIIDKKREVILSYLIDNFKIFQNNLKQVNLLHPLYIFDINPYPFDYVPIEKYISFDSYMLPTNELIKGELRLLEVDNPLVLRIRRFIRFILTSGDVLHSFSVPSLGLKMDTVPGRLNEITTYINREGLYFGQCSELCGVNHGFMPIELIGLRRGFIRTIN